MRSLQMPDHRSRPGKCRHLLLLRTLRQARGGDQRARPRRVVPRLGTHRRYLVWDGCLEISIASLRRSMSCWPWSMARRHRISDAFIRVQRVRNSENAISARHCGSSVVTEYPARLRALDREINTRLADGCGDKPYNARSMSVRLSERALTQLPPMTPGSDRIRQICRRTCRRLPASIVAYTQGRRSW